MTLDEVRVRFQNDLDEIAMTLIRAFNLEFNQEVETLSDPLCRWFDFRLRYIDPIPRKIFISHKFPKALPKSVAYGLNEIATKIRAGHDINGYQSKSLIRFNDFSGQKRSKRTDLLWADWGITHLHITDMPIPSGQFFSSRECSTGESWLLFALFIGDTVGFIDVRQHDDDNLFSDKDLILTVRQNWPEFMEQFKLHGMLAPEAQLPNEHIAKLRRHGINSPIVIDNEVFMGPGMGIATSCTPTIVTDRSDRIRDWIGALADAAIAPDGPILNELKKRDINAPDLSLCLTPRGLVIFEKHSDTAFIFNHRKIGDEYSEAMESLLLPSWAKTVIGIDAS